MALAIPILAVVDRAPYSLDRRRTSENSYDVTVTGTRGPPFKVVGVDEQVLWGRNEASLPTGVPVVWSTESWQAPSR